MRAHADARRAAADARADGARANHCCCGKHTRLSILPRPHRTRDSWCHRQLTWECHGAHAQVDAKTVKKLRDATGAGMMDCKKALVENNEDMEAAMVRTAASPRWKHATPDYLARLIFR